MERTASQSQKSQRMFIPVDLKVLMNHIYEYQKGVRPLVLFTFNERYRAFAEQRLKSQDITYIIQPAGNNTLNLFFGHKECIAAISQIVKRRLNELTPEEDFMLGALLGYDIRTQCERYCQRKCKCDSCKKVQ